jgi:hypothetical protein
MYVFAGLCLIGVLLGILMIPSELNTSASEVEIEELEEIEKDFKEI